MTAFRFHAYRDSEAPGVRHASLGLEPAYDDDNLSAALEWASIAKWGAMYVLLPRNGKQASTAKNTPAAEALLEAFTLEARQLGYRLSHARYGRGDASWRFRVERLITASLPLKQGRLLESDMLEQLELF